MISTPIEEKYNQKTISTMVAEDYRKAEIFKRFGIDFCCGGKRTLEETCEKKGVSVDEVTLALEALNNLPKLHSEEDYNSWDLDVLAEHIVNKHHQYLNDNFALLHEFSTKVAKVHGNGSPEVIEIAELYKAIESELSMHMHKEEAILFPFITHLAKAQRDGVSIAPPPFGSIQNPIRMMEAEHDSAGDGLKRISELSNNYTPPSWACNTYRVLYAKLQEFENDLQLHIHLENNILFPKAIKLEEELLMKQ
jgi:regulator of cell morphogenesis and NO signaling